MYPGGIADKSGNRFEARWLTRELLGLIDGRATSITVESIGDEDNGFEFVVERDALSEWHQCKRQTSATSWTIPALSTAGVIGNFKAKLNFSPAQRCMFVSTDTVKEIKRLKEKRAVAPTLVEFEQILSKDEFRDWHVLQDRLQASGESALGWLDRCEFHALSEEILERSVASEIAYWFTGDPGLIVGAVRAWVEEDHVFNRPINRATFLAFATKKKFELKQYEADQTLPGRIEAATSTYDASYGPLGAGLFTIERPETDQLVGALLGDSAVKIVALAGAAGSGKSGIIREAIRRIGALNHAQLAFRVDQVGEPYSLAQLGSIVIDVADSPAVVLEKLSGNRASILYIDQADAVSQMSGRTGQMRRQIVELVNQASRYPNIRLVFSCRTFDIDNDQLFTEIADRDETLRINVPPLDWDRDVVPRLQEFGISINPDNPRIKALLSQPIGLSIAGQLAKSGTKDLRNVENLSQLFDRLLVQRERAIHERRGSSWSIYAALEAVATEMSERQELVAPLRVLDPFAGARDVLQQEGLIVVSGQQISLLHESLFDYLHARAFVGRKQSLLDFLVSEEQTLFRRTQVRQILASERETEPKRYLLDLAAVLGSDNVRAHVRDLVLRWLSTVPQPTTDEWDILARYAAARGDGEVPRSLGFVLYDRPGWFELLSDTGVVEGWLNGSLEAKQWALNYLRSNAEGGARLASIVDAFLNADLEHAALVLERMQWLSPKAPAPEMAEVLIRALSMANTVEQLSQDDGPFELYASWIACAPADAARIFAASFAVWYRIVPDGSPFGRAFENGTGAFSHLVELAKARPLEALEALLPAMAIAMERLRGPDGPPHQDSIWNWRRRDQDGLASVEFLDVVRSSLAVVAAERPEDATRLLALLDPAAQITALHLLLETVASNGQHLASLLVEHREHAGLFDAGWDGADAYSAAKAIAAAWDWLDEETRLLLERRILGLWPEFDDVKWAASLRDPAKNHYDRSPQDIRGMIRHYLALSGLRQWSVMRTIGEERLSAEARERFRWLNRKGLSPEEPQGFRGGVARFPIASGRAAHMSDKSWLSAFEKLGDDEQGRWTAGGFRGGANELGNVLQNRVKEEPDRFLALLPHIPLNAHPAFANAIALGLSEGGSTAVRTERLFELLEDKAVARPDDRSLIWLIRATKEAKGPATLAFMLKVAASSDNGGEVSEFKPNSSSKPDPEFKLGFAFGNFLDGRAINSVQGSALLEIGSQAWENVELFRCYRATVEPLIGSDMPDHLHSSLATLFIAALKHDVDLAADWIVRTAKVCLPAFYTRSGRSALLWLDARRHEIARPIIERLAGSDDPMAQAIGCVLVTQRSLEDSRWTGWIDELIERGPIQRGAIADVAAAYLPDAEHVDQTTRWLIRLFDDEDEDVRTTAVDGFRRIDASNMERYADLYEAYVASRYFNAERTFFLHRLENAPSALNGLVLGLIEKTVARAKGAGTGASQSLYQIWGPLLRIYASSDTDAARLSRCLDVIDQLVDLDALGSNQLNAFT